MRLVHGGNRTGHLEEVWFPGAHADVGTGYCDSRGLERLSRRWMIAKFRPFEIFPEDDGLSCDKNQSQCERAQLQDAFIDAFGTFGAFGLHWRKPAPGDVLHGSIPCRIAVGKLPRPHAGREACGVYAPQNITSDLRGYTIGSEAGFQYLTSAARGPSRFNPAGRVIVTRIAPLSRVDSPYHGK